jgi:hypothetical protein
MSHCGGICGIEIDCPGACGVFCTADCRDCTQWCEPTTLPDFDEARAGASPGVLLRITREADGAKVVVGEAANRLSANRRTYPEDTQFKLCFNDIPRASLARLIGNMHPRAVRARDGKAEEKLSGQASGTVAELAAKYDLVVD